MATPNKTTSLRTPPTIKGLPLIGNLAEIQQSDMIEYYYDLWQQHGDIFRVDMGPIDNTIIVHPDHVQHVMVKNPETYIKGRSLDRFRTAIGNGIFNLVGDEWKERRKLMQPTYTPRSIEQFVDIMRTSAQDAAVRWRGYKANKNIDIGDEMTRVALSVITRSMFSIDLDREQREISDAMKHFLEYTTTATASIIDIPLFIPIPRNQKLKKSKKLVAEFIYGLIDERRNSDVHHGDLLDILMSATDDDGNHLTDEELHDEVLITLFAGHETTATHLMWTWYLLAQHPDAEAKLHAELDSVLGGRSPELDDLDKLPYAQMILAETLRLYSPIAMTVRDVTDEAEMDGYAMPKDSLVTIFPYATHRHPDFWEHPLAFHPEHFSDAAVEARPRYAYYPFGAGRRICIGNHFSQMEALVVLAELAQQFSPRLTKPNGGDVRFMGVIRPQKPIQMTLETR